MAARARELDIPPARCRAFGEERFSLQRMVEGYLSVYRRALAQQAGSETSAMQIAS